MKNDGITAEVLHFICRVQLERKCVLKGQCPPGPVLFTSSWSCSLVQANKFYTLEEWRILKNENHMGNPTRITMLARVQ